MFPLTFGLACCAIEMIAAVGSPRNDQARFGAEALRASPRQADFIILSGRVSIKMAPVIRRLYDQMLEPRWAISMGACSSSGGMFANYAVVQGADKFMPIDIHVPGCPPRPEALFYGFNKLQRQIQGNPDMGWRRRYNADRHRGVGARRRDRGPALGGGGGGVRASARGDEPANRSLMPDAPGPRADRRRAARRPPRQRPRHLPRARPGLPDRRPRPDPRGAALAARHAGPGVPLPRQRPRGRLPARRAALRRPLRAPEPRPRRADPGASGDRRPRRAIRAVIRRDRGGRRDAAAVDRELRAAVPDRRLPGARGLRLLRDLLPRPPGPAPDPDARGLRRLAAAPRLPDRRRAGDLHPQRAHGPGLVGSDGRGGARHAPRPTAAT